MADLLNVGQSALKAYSRALSTTADNIANSQTAGYVRRTTNLSEMPAGRDMPLYTSNGGSGGVTIEGLTRKIDDWLVSDARNASSNSQQASAVARWLTAGEASLADDEFGIGDALAKIFNSADQLSGDADNRTRRGDFLSTIQQTIERMSGAAEQLSSMSDGILAEAEKAVQSVQSQLDALAELNFSLQRAQTGSGNSAALLDERDRLLNGIAKHLAIETEVGFNGTTVVRTAGPGSQVLLDSTGKATLSMAVAADGSFEYTVDRGTPTQISPAAGSLAGLSTVARITSTRRDELDDLADDFAKLINDFQVGGLDKAGNTGTALVDASGGAIGLTMLSTDPDAVAAASATSSNGNILAFGGQRSGNAASTAWTKISAAHAQATGSARQQDEINASIHSNAVNARDASGAVDLDQEAADLMRFQQAYQGAARILQVAREIMQTIFNSL